MIYDIYDASIHSYPAGRLSDGVSFDRKILEIRQIPGGFLFPRISCHFELSIFSLALWNFVSAKRLSWYLPVRDFLST